MDDLLLIFLMVVGMLTLYWALAGQWRYNRIFEERSAEIEDKLKSDKKRSQ